MMINLDEIRKEFDAGSATVVGRSKYLLELKGSKAYLNMFSSEDIRDNECRMLELAGTRLRHVPKVIRKGVFFGHFFNLVTAVELPVCAKNEGLSFSSSSCSSGKGSIKFIKASAEALYREIALLHSIRADGSGCLVHGDLQPANLLCDGKEAGLVDFSFSHLGEPEEDLALIFMAGVAYRHITPYVYMLYDEIWKLAKADLLGDYAGKNKADSRGGADKNKVFLGRSNISPYKESDHLKEDLMHKIRSFIKILIKERRFNSLFDDPLILGELEKKIREEQASWLKKDAETAAMKNISKAEKKGNYYSLEKNVAGAGNGGKMNSAVSGENDLFGKAGLAILPERLSYLVTTGCNNNCIFCPIDKSRPYSATLKEARAVLESAIKAGSLHLNLQGGEPTIHPKIIDIVRHAKAIGYERISIVTNGRMLSYRKFAKDLISAGVDSFSVSLHGARDVVHDSLTQSKGSFLQAMKGLENIAGIMQKGVSVRYIMTKENIEDMQDFLKLMAGISLNINVEFCYPIPHGSAFKNQKRIYGDPGKALSEIVPVGGQRVKVRNFPVCLYENRMVEPVRLGKDYARNADLKKEDLEGKGKNRQDSKGRMGGNAKDKNGAMAKGNYQDSSGTLGNALDGTPTREGLIMAVRRHEEFIKTEACRRCLRNDVCEGIHKSLYPDMLVPGRPIQ